MKKTFIVVCLFVFAASFVANAGDKLDEYLKAQDLFNQGKYQTAQKELVNFLEKYGSYGDAFKMLRECNQKLAKTSKQNNTSTAAIAEISKLKTQLNAAEVKIKKLDAQIDQQKKDSVKIDEATKKTIGEIRSGKESLEKEIAELKAQVNTQKDTLNKKNKDLDSLDFYRKSTKRLQAQIKQLDSLSEKKNAMFGTIPYKDVEEIIHPEKFVKKDVKVEKKAEPKGKKAEEQQQEPVKPTTPVEQEKAQTTPQTGTEAAK